VPDKVDIHLQKLFLNQYRRIRKTMDETDVMLFADAVHPTYNMVAFYGWINLPPSRPHQNLIERIWKFFNEGSPPESVGEK
jgi:hypothetical protein